MRLTVTLSGIPGIQAGMLAFKGSFQSELFGPALAAQARVIRDRSNSPNFKFTDRSGRLRRSIQVNRIPAKYGGRRYKTGAAGVYAGGSIRGGREPTQARQAQLVERGHGGPVVARARPFLRVPVYSTLAEQQSAFSGSVIARFPQLANKHIAAAKAKASKRITSVSSSIGSTSQTGYAHLISRRGLGARRGFR